MSKPIKVGITHGDINGVGYEIILKSLADETMLELVTPVIFGYSQIAEKCRRQLGLEEMHLHRIQDASMAVSGKINIIDITKDVPELTPGQPTKISGESAVKALGMAVEAVKKGDIDVMVTAPISKEAVQGDNFHFPGHTEYLESAAGEGQARMILFNDDVRVALVTTHLPVSHISESITQENVADAISSLADSLTRDFGFERPRIAVLSLNPHCGDNGLLGNEEHEAIEPAIAEALSKGVLAFGPYPADGFFGNGDYRHFDGIVAMYHDQGLAPFKTIAGGEGVNFTAGLPFVRTSPDHGTAFGIAWKGEADPTSMREAIYKACDILRHRERYAEMTANPLQRQVARTSETKKGKMTQKDQDDIIQEKDLQE